MRSLLMDDPYVLDEAKARHKGTRPAEPIVRVDQDLKGGRFDPRGIKRVDFEGVVVEGVDFSRIRLDLFTSAGSTFIDCDFTRSRLAGGGFSFDPPSTFTACRFDGADLRGMWAIHETRFERCHFENAKIEGWRSDCGEFVDCVFIGKIIRSFFSGRPHECFSPVGRTRNEFRGNDFRKADIIDTKFQFGIDIGAQLWPSDPIYLRLDHWPERIARVRALVHQWPTGRERDYAELLLEIYGDHGMAEQQEVFIRRDNADRIPAVRDRLWSLFENAL